MPFRVIDEGRSQHCHVSYCRFFGSLGGMGEIPRDEGVPGVGFLVCRGCRLIAV